MEKIQEIFGKSRNIWILFIAWILFASNLWLPRNWGFYGTGDWDLTYSTFEVARISIIEYCEWPSYQSFLAFGSDLDANPQAVSGSIFIIPVLFLGTFYGYKLSILLAMLLGLWGSKKLFSLYVTDHFISTSMAIIFVGAPYFSRHIFEAGHSNFLFFYLLPWIFYWNEKFKISNNSKYIGYLTIFLALPISGGAPLVFIIAASGLFLLSLGYLFIEKRSFKILLATTIATIISLALNTWKILPAIELWENSPRLVKDESGINLLIYIQTLFDYQLDTNTPHQWHEFAIGFPIIMLVLSFYKILKINNLKYWLLLIIPIFWISLGNSPKYFNPWYLLNNFVPIFNSLRSPYRISVLSLLILCILFLKIYKYYNSKELIYLVLVSSILTQSLSYNSISNKMVYSKRIEDTSKNRQVKKLEIIKLNHWENENQFYFVKNQCIVQNAYEPLNLLKVTDSLTKFIQGGEVLNYKPNRITLVVNDTQLQTSIRYSKNWSLIGNGKITNRNGLLCVQNTHGKIELIYKNEKTKIGFMISLIALVFLSLLIRFTRIFNFKNQ